jgi:hypothetical protein
LLAINGVLQEVKIIYKLDTPPELCRFVFCGSDKQDVEGKILKYHRVLQRGVDTLNVLGNSLSVPEILLHLNGLGASEEGIQKY